LAYQGNMERALSALGAAMESLQAATPNKGGHRERAMRLIEHAMGEVQAGIDFAYQHGGGGYDAAADSTRGGPRPARLRFLPRRPQRS
jgi:hypothetical protein